MMSTPPPEVVGLGSATLDELWRVRDFSADEQVSQALERVISGGGPVATALCVLARLGHRCRMIDVCGDDIAGDQIRLGLEQTGVDCSGIQRVPETTSTRAVILVRATDGARQIHFLPSTAGEPVVSDAEAQTIRSARLLHINGRHESACREAVRIAVEAGVPVSFDGGAGRWRESVRDLVDASTVRIFSRDFAKHHTDKECLDGMMNALAQGAARVVVITAGAEGSWFLDEAGRVRHQPAFAPECAVDTTGCGDVYHGAFLHGWLKGLPLAICAETAARMAADNALGLGGRHACSLPQWSATTSA